MEMGISLINPARGLAERIPDNKVLRRFLRATPAAQRKDAYDALLPWLKFQPKPYLLLK